MGFQGSSNGGTLVPYKAIFSGDIPWNLGLNNRPYIWNRYLQFRFLEFPLIITIHLGIPFGWFLGIPNTGGSNVCNFLAGLFSRITALEFYGWRPSPKLQWKNHLKDPFTDDHWIVLRAILQNIPYLMRTTVGFSLKPIYWLQNQIKLG